MNFLEKLKRLYNKAEDLLMTSHECISCGREILDGSVLSLCEDCLKNLDRIDGKLCTKCGDNLTTGTRVCDNCKAAKYVFAANRSHLHYSDVASNIVKQLKFVKKKYLAKNIAEMMAERSEVFAGVDYLTFVPINSKRRSERGFNQAEEIALHLSKLTSVPVMNFLIKAKGGKHQTGLSRKDREKNLDGSFKLNPDTEELIKDKVILVIDDVFTTGTTLNECAKVLLAAKPAKVNTYTFAKTNYNLNKSSDNASKLLVNARNTKIKDGDVTI